MVVIGLTGFIGSGKTTVATRLIEKHGFRRGRFAGALKEMLVALLTYRGVGPREARRMVDGDLKEVPTPWLNGKSPRQAMESLGKDWGRECVSDDLWVDTEIDHIANGESGAILFEDVRFPNEAAAIRAMGGRVVRVHRVGLIPQDHPTEKAQAEIVPDETIINDPGEFAALYAQVDALALRARGL